ncbi:hypothetical protein K2X33_09865 [bacterium]|nr:hypothetical protein [bacterium]
MPTKHSKHKKSPSTRAGKYVREEMEQLHHGKKSPHSRKQAIAIGLSRARKAGVPVPKKKAA